jgi:Ca2+-binding EF-hand superfamily protein
MFLKGKELRENQFWALINPDRKTFLTREEMIEHVGNVRINLDAVDVGVFFDFIDEDEHGKITFEDFEKVMFKEATQSGPYWK